MSEITQNSILRISDEKTMQLIELYEKEECLWNTCSDDYKNREQRLKAAQRIAKKLNLQHFEHRHVIIKFKNLRNSYCQELKKIANSLNSGVGEEEVYRPRVFWFCKMDSFLRPHLQPPRGIQSNLLHIDDAIKREPEDTEEWVQMTNPEDVLIADTSNDIQSCSDNEDSRGIEIKPRKRTRNSSRNSVKRPKVDEEFDPTVQTLKDISSHLHLSSNNREDVYDNFGKYIASLLRSMPAQKALNLQPRIVSLITSAVTGSNEGRVSQSDENVSL